MPVYEVHLDGGSSHPERTCTVTVEADSEEAALAFAEEHNPSTEEAPIKAVSADLVKESDGA